MWALPAIGRSPSPSNMMSIIFMFGASACCVVSKAFAPALKANGGESRLFRCSI